MLDVEDFLVFGASVRLLANLIVLGNLLLRAAKNNTWTNINKQVYKKIKDSSEKSNLRIYYIYSDVQTKGRGPF